jgi:hypothetical protein
MDFNEDEKFYQAIRRVKIVGMTLMWIMVAACLGGVFGYGLWTKKTIGDPVMSIEYECFLRIKKSTPLKIMARQLTAADSLLQVNISSSYTEKVDILQITPKPEKIILQKGTTAYFFHIVPGTSDNKIITFTTSARKPGNCNFTVSNDQHSYSLHQFIYP